MPKYKKSFTSMDDAYRSLVPHLTSYARKHLISTDEALDAVHTAFTKALKYFQKNKKVNAYIMFREVARACKKMNKKRGGEVLADFSDPRTEKTYGLEGKTVVERTECQAMDTLCVSWTTLIKNNKCG